MIKRELYRTPPILTKLLIEEEFFIKIIQS